MFRIILTSAGIISCDYQEIKPTVQPLHHCCFLNHSNQGPLCSRLWNYCAYRTITCPQMFYVLCQTTFMNKYCDLNWNVKVYKLIFISTLHNLFFPRVRLCVFLRWGFLRTHPPGRTSFRSARRTPTPTVSSCTPSTAASIQTAPSSSIWTQRVESWWWRRSWTTRPSLFIHWLWW